MTDRELLEMAAKAAGRTDWDHSPYIKSDAGDAKPWWNPLTDDGDALRLAVKLELHIVFGANYVIVNGDAQMPTVNNANDPYAATRRAIVRAAAEIGRSIASASEAAPNGEKP